MKKYWLFSFALVVLVLTSLLVPARPAAAAENFIEIVAPKSDSTTWESATVSKPTVTVTANYFYSDSKTAKTKTVTVALMISNTMASREITELYQTGPESGTVSFNLDLSKPPYNETRDFRVLAYVKEAGWSMTSPTLGDSMFITYEPAAVPTKPSPTPTPKPSPGLSPTTAANTPVIVSFTANPQKIKAGEKVTLTWKVTGADSVKINGTSVNLEGSAEVIPTEARRQEVISAPGSPVTQLWTAGYDLAATSASGGFKNSHIDIAVTPLTMDEIFKEYADWGNTGYTWPDGTYDETPLVGPGLSGGTNNFTATATWLSGIGSYEGVRWDCNAMQYRTLACLNELKKSGKLCGWDYMGAKGAVLATTGVYPVHHAAAIWQTGDDWTKTATILDPHDKQKPARYPVTAGLDSMAPWQPDDYYSEAYPAVPGGEAALAKQYKLDAFAANKYDRWGNGRGASTPWQNEQTLPKATKEKVINSLVNTFEKPLSDLVSMMGVQCPVDVIVTNSSGQNLGRLANGQMLADFKPLDAWYEADPNGEKQWVYVLPAGVYMLSIAGTGSGTFRVLTYSGGEGVNDFGEHPITAGEQAVLSVNPGTIDELTLADGKTIKPQTVAIDSLVSSGSSGSGSLPVVLVVIVVLILILVIGISIRRRGSRARSTRTVRIPETAAPKNPAPVVQSTAPPRTPAPVPQAKTESVQSAGPAAQVVPSAGGISCVKCGSPVKSGDKFCIKCGTPVTPAPTARFCPKCGDPVKSGEKFCDKCGFKLT